MFVVLLFSIDKNVARSEIFEAQAADVGPSDDNTREGGERVPFVVAFYNEFATNSELAAAISFFVILTLNDLSRYSYRALLPFGGGENRRTSRVNCERADESRTFLPTASGDLCWLSE